jgi:hypothetical protein
VSGGRLEPGTYVYAAVAAAVGVGLLLVSQGSWRTGLTVVGGAMVAAGAVRSAVPDRLAGLLRIRRRASDVVLMVGMGAALITLAAAVPTPPV